MDKYYEELKKSLVYNQNNTYMKMILIEKIKKIERVIKMKNYYLQLIEAVKQDCDKCKFNPQGCNQVIPCKLEPCNKFKWIIDRAKYYEKILKIDWLEILEGWEKDRTYWYYNFYNDTNQPKEFRIFNCLNDYVDSIDKKGFRCPICNWASYSPYQCNACGYKIYTYNTCVYIKDLRQTYKIFTPIAWEEIKENESQR